jgi:hypothetical protein
LFTLARALKDRPEFVWGDLGDVKPIVRAWYDHSPAVCREEDFNAVWREFLKVFRKVKLTADKGPLREAWEAALRQPLPQEARLFEGDLPAQRLVGLCFQLQKHAGVGDFPLACRVAAKLLGVCAKTASNMLGALEGAGILVRTDTGSVRKAKANRYRYGSIIRW